MSYSKNAQRAVKMREKKFLSAVYIRAVYVSVCVNVPIWKYLTF